MPAGPRPDGARRPAARWDSGAVDYVAHFAREVAAFETAARVSLGAQPAPAVPSCPGWVGGAPPPGGPVIPSCPRRSSPRRPPSAAGDCGRCDSAYILLWALSQPPQTRRVSGLGGTAG